jgi:hypothetical protein
MDDGLNDWLPDRDLVLKEYFVAVVDILGQSERLRSVRLPVNGDDKAIIIPSLKNTYGLVHAFRKTFDRTFRTIATAASAKLKFTPEQAAAFHHLRDFRLVQYGVADSMFIGIPLDGPGQAAGVYAALLALAGVFLKFLSLGHILRGAADVGVASDFFPGELYGPAVACAYHLEKGVADYPRVVVGEGLLAVLRRWEASPALDPEAMVAQSMAAACRGLLAADPDGWPVLDYLGEAYQKANSAPGDVDIDELAGQALAKAQTRLRESRATSNPKLVARYVRLLQYFASRGAGGTPPPAPSA